MRASYDCLGTQIDKQDSLEFRERAPPSYGLPKMDTGMYTSSFDLSSTSNFQLPGSMVEIRDWLCREGPFASLLFGTCHVSTYRSFGVAG